VGHRALDCPNDWPNVATYHTLTQTDVDAAKHNCRGKTAAVVVTLPIDSVASVMPDIGRSDEDNSLISDEVSQSLRYTPTSKHLVWDCAADDRQSEFLFPINLTALIDDGSHVVMVKPEIANKLCLKRRKLPNPLRLSLAIKDNQSRMNNFNVPSNNINEQPAVESLPNASN
jgi:hypothetical protein